jgi:hypothetical protein
MKTAIQELIEKFQEYNKPKIKGLVRVNMSLDNVIEFCEEALKREKIDIKMAYNDGRKNALLKLNKNSEEYYNLTYNQKK